jgi:gas vesicle protein
MPDQYHARFPALKSLARIFHWYKQLKHTKSRIMNNTSKILLGLIAGIAIGGALGILLAPDKGSETRRKIVEKGSELGDSITGFGETVKEKISDVVDGVKGSFNKTRNATS